jgi:flagellar protein FlgJ
MSNRIQQTSANALAADGRSLNALKLQAGSTPASIKEAAKQFESLFMRELIKSMREATMKSGMLDSPGADLGADLLDQQFAVQMSGQPGGLSDLIAKQLTRQMTNVDAGANGASGAANGTKPATPASPANLTTPSTLQITPLGKGAASVSQTGFVQRHSEAAAKIEKDSGIPASYMLGQAGHETGWGKSQIKTADGSNSFNLFGIKAGANWTGKVASVTTTEYVNGTPQKTVAKFRAYDSFEDSFRDYANLINNNPRYAQARQQTGSSFAYASGLQKAGYATDPEYANKLSRAINTTLRVQRAQA